MAIRNAHMGQGTLNYSIIMSKVETQASDATGGCPPWYIQRAESTIMCEMRQVRCTFPMDRDNLLVYYECSNSHKMAIYAC